MLALLPVNVVCLLVVRRLYRVRGRTLKQALGVEPGRVGRDVLWGLLWLAVLYVPFALVIVGTVVMLYGADPLHAFATIFFDPASSIPIDPIHMLLLSIVAVVPFMLINAPTEELVVRGFALESVTRRFGAVAGVAVTSLAFGAQHIVFAATPAGMLVFFLAFTVWGVVASLIVRRQGRLFPVVVAHLVVNVVMSAPGIVFPILQLTGVLPATGTTDAQ